MRGQTFFSYALVAFAITAYAVPVSLEPLETRTDDLLEAREPYVIPETGITSNIGAVDIGKEYIERRQEGEDDG